PLFRKGTRRPALHSRRGDGNPINSSGWIRDVPADILEALTPEKLTTASHMVFTLKAIPGRVITIFEKWSSGDTEPRVLGKSLHQKRKIIRIERKVSVQVTDHFKL